MKYRKKHTSILHKQGMVFPNPIHPWSFKEIRFLHSHSTILTSHRRHSTFVACNFPWVCIQVLSSYQTYCISSSILSTKIIEKPRAILRSTVIASRSHFVDPSKATRSSKSNWTLLCLTFLCVTSFWSPFIFSFNSQVKFYFESNKLVTLDMVLNWMDAFSLRRMTNYTLNNFVVCFYFL